MKILIMTDMEGVSGIVTWAQVNGGAPMYEEGRRLYTEEINAAVRGAKRAGASEIVVVDCHGAGGDWSFNSLIPELLDVDCTWVAHHPWSALYRIAAKWRRCLPAGRHARAQQYRGWRFVSHDFYGGSGTTFGLTMTWWVRSVLMRLYVGHYVCPVLLVTGDEAVCRESTNLLGEGLD